jgi:protein-S-isoprenylcysteine O-methyltransferase Ste14
LQLAPFLRRHRRTIGIPLVLAALILARYNSRFLIPSLVLVTIGELIRICAAGHLQKEKILTTGGPYRFIRNPLYLGSFLIAIGFGLISGSIWVWILIIAYFVLVYIPVIRYEETILHEKFSEYPAYAAKVPAFYPTIFPYSTSTTQFSLEQAWRNREYNAVLGIIVVYVILIFVSSQFS